MICLFLGLVLHILGLKFLGELSYFTCCTVMLVGIEYIILHHITYFTGEKIERVVSVFFYTGIVCLILRVFASFIFKEDYYAGIGIFLKVHGIIIFLLNVGAILLPLSIAIMFLKFRKIIKFLSYFFQMIFEFGLQISICLGIQELMIRAVHDSKKGVLNNGR